MDKLTKRDLLAVEPPKDRKKWVWIGDGEVPGFGAKIYGTGARVFALRYRTRKGRHRMLKLGVFGETHGASSPGHRPEGKGPGSGRSGPASGTPEGTGRSLNPNGWGPPDPMARRLCEGRTGNGGEETSGG